MKKVFGIFAFIFFFLLVSIGSCSAISDQSFYLENTNTNLVAGEDFSVNLNIATPEDTNVAVFRVKIIFDDSVIKFKGIHSEYGTDDFKMNAKDNTVTIIYLTSERGVNLKKNSDSTFLEINFKVLSSVSYSKITKISAVLDSIADYNSKKISENDEVFINKEINICEAVKYSCDLETLVIKNYDIEPTFSKRVTQYKVTVPPETENLLIDAQPDDKNATVQINRTSLNAAGRSTDIKISVIGADNKSKKIYRVTVNRQKTTNTLSHKQQRENKSSYSEGTNFSESKTSKEPNEDSHTINIERNHFKFIYFLIIAVLTVLLGIIICKLKIHKTGKLDFENTNNE